MNLKTAAVALSLSVTTAAFAGAPPKDQAILDKGKAAFTTNCAACHGEKGDGTGPAAAALNPKPRNYATDVFKQGDKVEDIFKTLQTGVPNTPMVSFSYLPEADRWALAYWVLELKAQGKGGAAAAAAPAKDAGAAPAKKDAAPAKKK